MENKDKHSFQRILRLFLTHYGISPTDSIYRKWFFMLRGFPLIEISQGIEEYKKEYSPSNMYPCASAFNDYLVIKRFQKKIKNDDQ